MIRHEVRCKSLPFQDGCRPRGTAPLRDDHCAGIGCTRTKFARCRVFDILFMIPFMTPPYMASMGWILFMQKKGAFAAAGPSSRRMRKDLLHTGRFGAGDEPARFSVHAHHAQKRHAEHSLQSGRGRCSVRRRIRCPDAQDLSAAALRQLCHRCAAGVCENAV